MKTNVTQTSIASYDALRTSGFKGQHATILNRMQPGKPYSRRQIAMQTGLETSAVAGRVNELLEAGALVVCGTLRCPITGRTVEVVRIAEQQMEMAV